MVPRKQAGHMTCTRPQAERQILLATRASSTHDPKRTRQNDRGKFNVVLHLCEGTAHIFLGALLARPDNGERAMSLRSVTAKIDNVIFAAFVAICLLIWAVLGFPLVIEIAMTAASVVVIFFFVSWMEF